MRLFLLLILSLVLGCAGAKYQSQTGIDYVVTTNDLAVSSVIIIHN